MYTPRTPACFRVYVASYSQLIGHRDVIGKTIREALPELADQRFFELLDQVYASGKPFVGRRLPVLLQTQQAGQTERRYSISFINRFWIKPENFGIFVREAMLPIMYTRRKVSSF